MEDKQDASPYNKYDIVREASGQRQMSNVY